MTSEHYKFAGFVLDPGNRRLLRDGAQVDVNSRYLDALILLVRQHGQLVSKQRFLDEVWQGVPVTDDVLTQCIKVLRKQLRDEAANPQFIETVPKHGYRFIAPVESGAVANPSAHSAAPKSRSQCIVAQGTGGALGGGVAGAIGGVVYGFTAAAQSAPGQTGAISVVLVVLALTTLIAVIGGAGVGLGIAAARILSGESMTASVAGGAAGGLAVGALVKLLGIDAFNLLFGQSPGDVTGAVEGLILGAAVGLGIAIANRRGVAATLRHGVVAAALIGAAAGCLIAAIGGRLMIGSLDLLVRQFAGSRLRLDPLGHLLGESGLGAASGLIMSGFEGALFAACVVGALAMARR